MSSPPLAAAGPSARTFDSWLQGVPAGRRERGRAWRLDVGGLRFAFYGRISTQGYQDPVSSRAWQWEAANRLIGGRGHVTVEFFDTGTSRSLPWNRRPQASLLLAAAAEPGRDFDAVVVGEFERAFAGGEAFTIITALQAVGVQMWLPEAHGPIDLTEPDHRALLMMLGHQSEREVLRNRTRTCAAMAAQVRDQGRNLGGRPPYGYQLVDAGPHPNTVHAAWGRRRHRLEVDPVTAPHVRWIFAQRLDGMSTAAIARTFNERRVPSPGAYDRARNPHRQQAVWTLRTVAAILANPRYTGRQVWNRQFTDHREAVPGDKRSSLGPVRVWNPRTDWVISSELTHPALISDTDFTAAQHITAIGAPADGRSRRYALTGLLICAMCGRRLTAHWTHHKPAYRCRHGHTTAHPTAAGAPPWVYWAQGTLVRQMDAIGDEFAGHDDVGDLAAYLKARGLVIVCGARTLAIEPAIRETVEATQPEGPATHKTGKPSRQIKPEAVQLELPLPLQPRRRGRTATRVLRRRRKARNPTRSHAKRE